MALQITGEATMILETKKQLQERFIEEFLRRLREAPPDPRVYLKCDDMFKDTDVHSLDEWQVAREAAVVSDDDEGEDTCR